MKKIVLFVVLHFCFAEIYAGNEADILKERVCEILPTLQGWCTTEKALHFIDLVLEVEPKVCVEIGVYGGSSVFPVASALKLLGKGVIIGIDPWDKAECLKYVDPIAEQAFFDWWKKVNMNHIYLSFINMLKKYKLEEYCIIKKMTSQKASSEIDAIDILYIDGNHSEISSTQDVMMYLPKVCSGGYIWMDDALWEGTQQALNILSDSCEIITFLDKGNCILFKKR